MTIDTTTLNDNQLEAVKWQDGPLLVLAGPGSGKTRVLTYRIARLLEDSAGKHFKILGLTFTNKAAAEMRERIESFVPNAGERTLLTTFHSFTADLLRQHGHYIGLKPDFTILSQEADRCALLDNVIDEVSADYGDLSMTGERVLPLMSRLIDSNIAPDATLEILKKRRLDNPKALAAIYARYRASMIEHNTLDFGGLIAEALGLLETRSGVRKQIQRVYPYICVDEFQDTNASQYKILMHLVNPATKNLFVVADDDQIIYQWNGASPERLNILVNDYNMTLLQLPENYRCPAAVVELANKLIAHNLSRYAEKGQLIPRKPVMDYAPVRLQRFDGFADEAQWVASDIAEKEPSERSKCVVLARTKKLLEEVVQALIKNNVNAYLGVRKNEFESASLQWVHSILRLANARSNREYLRRTCKAFYTLEGIDLNVKDIVSRAIAEDGDYLRAWAQAVLGRAELSTASRDIVLNSVSKLSERLDFWGFLTDAFAWLDRLPSVSPDISGVFDEYEEEKATWELLVNEIRAQYGHEEVTLHLLLQELDLRSKTPEPAKDAVRCFTIHACKGMEFDHVYLIGLVEDQLPSWAAKKKGDDSREMQEERRNCFVAITRTQETLTLTYSSEVSGWSKDPSRFLYEMEVLEKQ